MWIKSSRLSEPAAWTRSVPVRKRSTRVAMRAEKRKSICRREKEKEREKANSYERKKEKNTEYVEEGRKEERRFRIRRGTDGKKVGGSIDGR